MSVVHRFLGGLLVCYGFAQAMGLLSPEFHQTLCRYSACWDPSTVEMAHGKVVSGATRPEDAVRSLREELSHDPASCYRWADLAEAYQDAGDDDRASFAMERAAALGPYAAPLLLRVANFHLRSNQTSAAFQTFRRILAITPAYDTIAFSAFDRFGSGVGEVLWVGLPPLKRPAQAWFEHQIERKQDLSAISQTWLWLESHSLTDRSMTVTYVNHLVLSHSYERARELWPYHSRFEFPASGAILDWNVTPPAAVQADVREGVLHLTFRDPVDFYHVFQDVIVAPGTKYRFEASIQAEGLTSERGVSFHIFDVEDQNRLSVFTDQIMGSVPWTRETVTFVTPKNTRLLRIEIRGSHARGAFWARETRLSSLPNP